MRGIADYFSVAEQQYAVYLLCKTETMRIGRKDCKITEEEIYALLQKVGLEEYVSTLPKGIEPLSEGQSQAACRSRIPALLAFKHFPVMFFFQ